jgi:amino acid adenylation domain-containing protein
MLVNNVVLRTNLAGNPKFIDLLAQVRAVTLDAYANEDVPFDHVVRALEIERDDSRNPIFQVMFSFHDSPLREPSLPEISFECVEAISNRSAKFDMNVIVIPRPERSPAGRVGENGMTLIWEYSSDLFEPATIERMACHYLRLLKEISADPFKRLSEISILSEQETQELLQGFNRTRQDYPSDRCIHRLFEEQVERTPEATAVICDDRQLTYRKLNNRANRLAHYLQKLGVGPEVPVGLCVERSREMVVGLLGILKAGGAYVPLDPSYPKERLEFMLEDTRAAIVLTEMVSRKSLPVSSARVIYLDRDWDEIAKEPRANPSSQSTADNLAYVIYTSGSTGIPKGVEVCHRSVVRLLFGVDYVQLDRAQAILQLAPISFDAATFEVWGALLHGGKCVLFPGKVPSPREFGTVLRKHRVNTLWLTAALFNTVIDEEPQALSDVKQLLIGGEALSLPHVRKGLALLSSTKIINGYGPTESTTFTCCYAIPRQLDYNISSIPIGKPIGNTQVYILDPYLNPVPIGVAGELHIGGDGLARGYLNRAELTAEKFITNPFSNEPMARLYKTGDLARYLPDGNIEFLGRIDNQVKIRGYRIELGEIEAVLAQYPAVREAVVLAREESPGDKRLVAYVVPNLNPAPASHALRSFLKEKLPDYLVPSAFVFLDSLPLTPHGKVDRKALPAPEQSRPELDETFSAPRTAVEGPLAGIWAEVLKIDKVGIHDNFFDLGGHSLLATQVVSRIRRSLRVEVPLRTMFEAPTIAGLAIAILKKQAETIDEKNMSRILADIESLSNEEIERQVMDVRK